MVTLDVVLLLPAEARARAVASSETLARTMAANGYPSHFRLGEPYSAGADTGADAGAGVCAGVCEPHISLFMLAAARDEVAGVVAAVRRLAAGLAPLRVRGEEYRHNPSGAPEMYYARSAAWNALQRGVIEAVEPLRRGRLRAVGPSGESPRDMLTGRIPADPAAVAQLRRYGYDEVADTGTADRFRPHVTLAWPGDARPCVELGGLPPAHLYSGVLSDIAVYLMSPYGTCTTDAGTFALSAPDPALVG